MNPEPSAQTRADYATWDTEMLHGLRDAFVLDREQAIRERRSTAFIDGRLALIGEILAARAVDQDPRRPLL